jgi:hypothetical protein
MDEYGLSPFFDDISNHNDTKYLSNPGRKESPFSTWAEPTRY